jgi:hypothetical protein
MSRVHRQHHGYVSPYLEVPARTLAQAEADRQEDAAAPESKSEDKPPANDREKK